MRKIALTTTAVAAVALLALSGCSSRSADTGSGDASGFEKGSLIGVALPDKTSENWVLAGDLFTSAIEDAGFKADVQYAGQSTPVPDQQSQISSMTTKGAKVIIIGAKDGGQLGTQVKDAKAAGATVIAYDRLLTDTKDVDYYVAFDNYKVGELQGQALLDGLKAKFPDKSTYNIELFAGDPGDANAPTFFDGAMSVLKPEIEKGTLKVVSGQTEFKQVSTKDWLAQNAQNRMDTLIQGNYASTDLDGVLSPNDTLARAILQSVSSAGKPDIVVTGQDSEEASIPLIMSGKQYMTIYKDTRELVKKAIDMTTQLSEGGKADTTTTTDNGVKKVPTYYLDPVIVTKDNAAEAYKNNPDLEALTKQ
ncbi:sugar-binding protein [Schumannella sp. 10F1B-5-1]|uniref:substrate-binding domain-containing protein n=1 Tax=Schumannella sp. 10F1B-5-1 TaxID=2590780 RepID=UPI00112FF267|nr:sugar-binding protein [Schumannella sp. 10F1B-5-1]TPW73441.1 sugar ABC transporter substrate-binding protein [Schumannella sp. 10F1B-5-1]